MFLNRTYVQQINIYQLNIITSILYSGDSLCHRKQYGEAFEKFILYKLIDSWVI